MPVPDCTLALGRSLSRPRAAAVAMHARTRGRPNVWCLTAVYIVASCCRSTVKAPRRLASIALSIVFAVVVAAAYTFLFHEKDFATHGLLAGLHITSSQKSVVWKSGVGTTAFYSHLKVSSTELANTLELVSHDVVMCLSASADKTDALVRVISSWEGPIAIAIFCRDDAGEELLLEALPVLLRGGRNTALVLVRALVKDMMYPINAMRNFATALVPSDLGFAVFVQDADMLMSRGAYTALVRINANGDDKRAYVIPCFEFGADSYDMKADVRKIPRTKAELVLTTKENLTRQSKVSYFPRGHSCTEYARFLYGNDVEPWPQSTYHWQYDPFYMARKTFMLPRYDEEYVFWACNKQSNAFLLFALGFRFWTVPNVFSVHHPHSLVTDARIESHLLQIKRNRARYLLMRTAQARRYNVDLAFQDYEVQGTPNFTMPK